MQLHQRIHRAMVRTGMASMLPQQVQLPHLPPLPQRPLPPQLIWIMPRKYWDRHQSSSKNPHNMYMQRRAHRQRRHHQLLRRHLQRPHPHPPHTPLHHPPPFLLLHLPHLIPSVPNHLSFVQPLMPTCPFDDVPGLMLL